MSENHEPMASLRPAVGWLDRVKVEREELAEKLVKLSAFIESEPARKVNASEFADLRQQQFIMSEYVKVLDKRIHRSGKL